MAGGRQDAQAQQQPASRCRWWWRGACRRQGNPDPNFVLVLHLPYLYSSCILTLYPRRPPFLGAIDLILGHYGLEVEEEGIIIFVGTIPILVDVMFKYWIFTGLNKISPGAVVTLKHIDRH